MSETSTKFQAVAFATTTNTPHRGIVDLARHLETAGLGEWQLSLITGTAPGQTPFTGHEYRSPDHRWIYRILPTQLSVLHIPAARSQGPPSIDQQPVPLDSPLDFAVQSARILSFGLQRYGVRASRAAVLLTSLSTASAEDLAAPCHKLLRTPSAFPTPFEWNYRVAYRQDRLLGERQLATNSILSVRRGQFTQQAHLPGHAPVALAQISGLELTTDINTVSEESYSLTSDDVSRFIMESPNWHSEFRDTFDIGLAGSESAT